MTKARTLANNALTAISTTELGFLDGVSSAIQTQIDSKIGSASAISPTLIDAKGDIITATAADTPARLAVGTNNHVLTADSSEATGLKWAAASSGTTFAGCSLTKTGSTTVSNATSTAIPFDTENFDTNGYHNNSSNNTRITIPAGKGGYYLLNGFITIDGSSTGERQIIFYKNGVSLGNVTGGIAMLNTLAAINFNYTLALADSDYVELYVYQASGGSLDVKQASTFIASYLGA